MWTIIKSNIALIRETNKRAHGPWPSTTHLFSNFLLRQSTFSATNALGKNSSLPTSHFAFALGRYLGRRLQVHVENAGTFGTLDDGTHAYSHRGSPRSTSCLLKTRTHVIHAVWYEIFTTGGVEIFIVKMTTSGECAGPFFFVACMLIYRMA